MYKITKPMFLVAFFLIALGVMFLLRNIGILPGNVWSILWPVLLISIGLYVGIIATKFNMFLNHINRFIERVEKTLLRPFDNK
jgi:hypothetical protein